MMSSQTLLENTHFPVMLNEVFDLCFSKKRVDLLDCTFGGGGYSREFLKIPNSNVVAIDRDTKVIQVAQEIKKKHKNRFIFFNNRFSQIEKILSKKKFDAIIFDLGLSTIQLKDYTRGFSFNSEFDLDMRMDPNSTKVEDIINNCSEELLKKIIKDLGDEGDAGLISKNIAKARKLKKIIKVKELAEIIKNSKKYQYSKINPCTKTFQALRIFANREISELINGIASATKFLKPGGKLIIISFHSIEDKIVKYYFKNYSSNKARGSRYLPEITKKDTSLFEVYKNKIIRPSLREVKVNPPSRSAKLRFVIRNSNNYQFPNDLIIKFKNLLNLESAYV